jgi:molybdate transport system substrate-binding protein
MSAIAAAMILAIGAPHARAESPAPARPEPAAAKTLMVFAAASLKNALDEAAEAFRAATGVTAIISYASSMTLARQIEAGAPAEIFVSADAASMDYLAERRLIDPASRVDLFGNSLVVVAPASSPLQELAFAKEAFLAALGEGRIATGDPASVPAGKYAKAALEKLGLWSALEARFAFADNVRSALVFVARGEAPLGVVYATDALAERKVKIVAAFPPGAHPRIVYPAAATPSASGDAKALLAFLRGAKARDSFLRRGFSFLPR